MLTNAIQNLVVAVGAQVDNGAFQNEGHQSVERFVKRCFVRVHLGCTV